MTVMTLMTLQNELGEFRTFGPPAAAIIGGLLAGILARVIILPLLAKAAAKSQWKYDDVLVDAIKGPLVLAFLVLGLRLSLRLLRIEAATEQLFSRVTLVLGIVIVTWAMARFAAGATRAFAARGALPGVSILANIALFLVIAIGFLIALQTLGIAITPVITALGVGGLAVGLALQDTLANFFAGIRLLAGGRLRRGDFVKLESGQEGWIEDITWGSTTIREGVNDMVIVPNAKLAQAVTINYSLPDTTQLVVVNLRVAMDSDLAAVERVTLEAAREAQNASRDAIMDHDPVVRFQDYSDTGVRFSVVLRARSYPDRGGLQHEFMKLVHQKYRDAGINVPVLAATTGSRPAA